MSGLVLDIISNLIMLAKLLVIRTIECIYIYRYINYISHNTKQLLFIFLLAIFQGLSSIGKILIHILPLNIRSYPWMPNRKVIFRAGLVLQERQIGHSSYFNLFGVSLSDFIIILNQIYMSHKGNHCATWLSF